MPFAFEERASDAPFVEKIWRTRSDYGGTFTSLAASQCEMVVTQFQGQTYFTVRGPETQASVVECTPDAEFLGIVFQLGTYMPLFPAQQLLDKQDMTLPAATSQSFWLNGSAWDFPDFDNADTFVRRLVRQGLLVQDQLVAAVLDNTPPPVSPRTIRRRFLHATGLTPGVIRQIERARHALMLLQQCRSILDTVYEAGYFDQPHLTRSLKHFVGQTPAQIAEQTQPVSLLYKTEALF